MNFRYSRLQSKKNYQGYSGALHNDKGVILQEEVTTLKVCLSYNKASKYVRQELIEQQEETDISTIIVRDFNIP